MRYATGDHQKQRAQTVAKTRRCRAMLENALEDGLLVRVEPLEWAEQISHRMVTVERLEDGALLLEADPAWAGAINAVLVKKGVRVSELRRVGRTPALGTPRMAFSGDVQPSLFTHL
jgi:hypothetical protein